MFLEFFQKPPGGTEGSSGNAWIMCYFLGFYDELLGGKSDSARRREHYAKMLFFVLFAQQEPPSTGFIPPGARLLISGC